MEEHIIARAQARMIRTRLGAAGLSARDLWRSTPRSADHLDELEIEAFLHHALHLAPSERDLLVFATNYLLGPPDIPYSWELRLDDN